MASSARFFFYLHHHPRTTTTAHAAPRAVTDHGYLTWCCCPRDARQSRTRPGCGSSQCATAGLLDHEAALADAIVSGHVAGAALDVFETEPATNSPLFELDNVICTPHLGAATAEAQENVALQIAEQILLAASC